jgi:hypothetical protein
VIFVVITALPTFYWNATEEPEDEGNNVLQNISVYLLDCTVSYPRRLWI